jgi:hypothetical protein
MKLNRDVLRLIYGYCDVETAWTLDLLCKMNDKFILPKSTPDILEAFINYKVHPIRYIPIFTQIYDNFRSVLSKYTKTEMYSMVIYAFFDNWSTDIYCIVNTLANEFITYRQLMSVIYLYIYNYIDIGIPLNYNRYTLFRYEVNEPHNIHGRINYLSIPNAGTVNESRDILIDTLCQVSTSTNTNFRILRISASFVDNLVLQVHLCSGTFVKYLIATPLKFNYYNIMLCASAISRYIPHISNDVNIFDMFNECLQQNQKKH